jgi:probable HAF family extracellular repeat protein
MTKTNRLVLSVLAVLSLAAFAAAQSYTITDLGGGDAYAINGRGDVVAQEYPSYNSFVWSPGGSILALAPLFAGWPTLGLGINSQGLAVGAAFNGLSDSAVLWTNGQPLDLGTLPGGTSCAALGISASVEVAGFCQMPTGEEAFLWTKTTGMQGLGYLQGGPFSTATAINRFGQIAGYSGASGSGYQFYAFIWSKATGMKNLGKLPGYDASAAFAINDLGQVAGYSYCKPFRCPGGHAVLWSKTKGSMLDLGVLPGETSSLALGMNNVGQIVGSSGNYRAFVWSPSTGMLDLNNLIPANSGWVLEFANAINDGSQIVGFGTLNGQIEAFLLTPQ